MTPFENAFQMWCNQLPHLRSEYEQALQDNPDITVEQFLEKMAFFAGGDDRDYNCGPDAEVSDGEHLG